MQMIDSRPRAIPEFELTDRLRRAREFAGFDQARLAEALGISRNSVGNYESGRRLPTRPYLIAWADVTGVDAVWLETGTAPADAGAVVEPPAGIEPATYSLQGYEIPDTVADLLALWAVEA